MEILTTWDWCRISIYELLAGSATRELPWGKPDPNRIVFNGLEADQVRMSERAVEREKRPTGNPYPRFRQHVANEHVLTLGRVWLHREIEDGQELNAPAEFQLIPNRLYFFYFVSCDSNAFKVADIFWQSRLYCGVSVPELITSGSADSVAFLQEQTFRAMFCRKNHGSGSIPWSL